MNNILLLWDVDGTLLHNPSHGHQAEHMKAVSSFVADPQLPDQIDGSTDYAILHSIFRNSGFSKEEADALYAPALAELERLTTDPDLIRKSRRPIPGAGECLEQLGSFLHTYATGNSPARAQAKLAQFNLDQFLDGEIGGFGWWTSRRADFVQRAIDLAQRKYSEDFLPVVIGDTPFDISSAHEVGARSVAVAGGVYSANDLKEYDPHLVLEDLQGEQLQEFLLSIESKEV